MAEVKHWVERVVDGHLSLRDFLRSIPECRDLRTSGTGIFEILWVFLPAIPISASGSFIGDGSGIF